MCARRGRGRIGLVGTHTADAIAKAGAKFIPPAGVTVEGLLAACKRADAIDQVILDMDVITVRLRQANLIFDGDVWEMLRKVNDQLKAQGKHDPELLTMFAALVEFMRLGPHAKPDPAE